MSVRSSVRALALPAAVALALTASAAPAHAHVGMTASTTTAGSSAVLTFSVPHGCDGSPTVRIAIQIPETITRVNPTRHPLYSVTVTKRTLDQPITDGHGNQVTQRDDVIVYLAKTPLPDGQRDAFELALTLPNSPGRWSSRPSRPAWRDRPPGTRWPPGARTPTTSTGRHPR